MQPHKLIQYATIIIVLFYFSTSHGFLNTCPKRNSLTDECYEQQDDKHSDFRRLERRVTDVPQREVRSWRKEDRHIPSTYAENRRVPDKNNNRITFRRERILTDRRDLVRERSTEIRDQLISKNDLFRSFSQRSDRMNTNRRNADNSIQKPTMNVRRDLEATDVDQTAQRKERFFRIHEAGDRRSRQANSNELRQREATTSAGVFREQIGIREAETRIRNVEHTNIRQDKNGSRNRITFRQADRVLNDHRNNENDSQRSSVRASDDRRRAFVRSSEDFSRFRFAQDGRQADHRSTENDGRRSSIRAFDNKRRAIVKSTEDSSRFKPARDGRQADRVLTDHRNIENDSRRSSIRVFDNRWRAIVRSIEDSSRFGGKEQVSTVRDGRQSSIRRESVFDARDASSSRSRREERTSLSRDSRQFSTRREIALTRASADDSTFRREERSSIRRELFSPDARRNVIYSRSTRQQLATDTRQDTISSRLGQEQRESRQSSTRRLVLWNASSSAFRREERTRDNRLLSIRRELVSPNSRLRDASLHERSSFARENRETSSDVRRDDTSAMFRREERILSIRDESSIRRRRTDLRRDSNSFRFRQEARDNRQTLTQRSDVRREIASSAIKREERISSARDGPQSSVHQELTRRDAGSSAFRKERRSFARYEKQIPTRRLVLDGNRRDTDTSMIRREIARRELSTKYDFALSSTRRDIPSSRIRQERTSNHRELNEERKQYSKIFPTRQNRSTSRANKDSIQQFAHERSTFSSTARTNRQRLVKGHLQNVDDVRRNERRQSPVFLSNGRRHSVSPSKLNTNSGRLFNRNSRASFSERVKSEIRDNLENFGYEQVQLTGKISQDWSNLAKTLLIALTLFQILAKTYPKKIGFQNLLHNSLGCAKQKVH